MSRTKLALFIVAMLALAAYVVGELRRELSPPETLIRWVLEEAIEEFNDDDPHEVMEAFAEHFEDESGDYDRSDLTEGLRYLCWFSGEDYHAELREEQLVIQVDQADRAKARVSLGVAIRKDGQEDGKPWWDMHAQVDFEKQGSRWRITRSREVNHPERGR